MDYAGFLSQHDLVYRFLPTDGEMQGMPVANGQTGAQVWQNDVRTSIDTTKGTSYLI